MFEFTAYNKNFTVFVNTIFSGSDYGIRCTYEQSGESKYLHEYMFTLQDVTTKESTDAVFTAAIQAIDAELQATFGEAPEAGPEAGIERLEWLLRTNLEVVNNHLVEKQ